ncbi:hypothetical protein SFRURICE_019930 [Spodoptera frugiperda]|nr:hypothetical protein SFRURICE_019930 [Spodoptera frugiperda]
MSFGLPPLKVKPEHVSNIEPQEGPFGVPNPLVAGMAATKSKLGMSHPIEISERNVGHLPFLQRSNFQHDVLTGKHLDIGFEDILNTPEMCEVAGQPHAVVERSLGIL